jgi:glucose 1-dehydrogenase
MENSAMKGLRGKTALVTGATSGIGQAIALRLAVEGCNVAINYRSRPDDAEATRQEVMEKACQDIERCEVKALLVKGDVSKPEDVVSIVNQVIEAFGHLDILVNNAGIQQEDPSHQIELDSFDQVLAVNLRGAYLCARETLQHLLAQNRPGCIINISSVHEIIPRPQYLSYSISKGGLGNMTKTLALEYAAQGIRVNGVAPGATVTPINDAWTEDPEKQAEVESHIPMGRAGTTEEMAAAVAFLASDEAAYITGQTLYIDGGLTLYADFRESWSA